MENKMKRPINSRKMSRFKPPLKNVITGFALASVLLLASCGDDDEPAPAGETTLGYLLYTFGDGQFITASDTMFSGVVNVVNFENALEVAGPFTRNGGVAFNDGFYAPSNQSGDPGIQKYSINDNGNVQADGFISNASAGAFGLISNTKGYYVDITRSTTALQTFDPSAMQRTGQVDFPTEVTQYVNNSVANINLSSVIGSGNHVFTQINFQNAGGNSVYDSTFVVVVNTNTDSYEQLLIYPNAYNMEGGTVDNNGDVYIRVQDSNPAPGLPVASTEYARILSGTTSFDMSFGTNGIFGFRGVIDDPGTGAGSIGALVAGEVHDGIMYIRLKSDELVDISQIFEVNFDAYVVDMNTGEGFKVQDIPSSGFAAGTLENAKVIDGLAYYPISNPDFQGYYTYDIVTGEVAKAIELQGGKPSALVKLVDTE